MTPIAFPTPVSVTGKPQFGKNKDDDVAKTLALQTALSANTLAADALNQIQQLQAAAQKGDTFALQKIQTLAEQALSQVGNIHSASGPDAVMSAENARYIANAAIQKTSQLQASSKFGSNGVGEKLRLLA